MASKVKTYLHPKEWMTRYDVDELESSIHVCATNSMKTGISKQYTSFKKPILTIAEVIKNLFPDWFNEKRRIETLLQSSVILMETRYKFEDKYFDYIVKNKRELLETIYLLRFIGIVPVNFDKLNLDGKERAFLQYWKECVLYSQVYKNQCALLDYRQGSTEVISKSLKDKYGICLESDKLVLHGFYFITPEQQIVLKLIEKAGGEITFFNLYDDRYEDTFNFVKKFINEDYGWPSNWEMESKIGYPSVSIGAEFLLKFEKGNQESKTKIKSKNTIKHYKDFNIFLQKVIIPTIDYREDHPTVIVSTSADILNQMISNYFPDRKNTISNYLKYPIGKFLINLHSIYKEEGNSLEFSVLVELFSSGFLHNHENENANNYIKALYDIESYCLGCKTFKQWKQRLNQLKELNENIELHFKEDGTRMSKFFGSPFKRLSYANVSPCDIEKIADYITMISEMVETLFKSGNTTFLNQHYKKVQILVQNLMFGKDINKEDLEVMEKINVSLEGINNNIKCLYTDICDSLSYYLSGKSDENLEPLIVPFIEVDGLAFRSDCSKYYFSGLDEGGLPLGKYEMPYPLSKQTILDLSRTNREIKLLIDRNNSINKISRYLLYIVLEFFNENMYELSWMSNFADKKNLEKSIYMSLLEIESENIPVEYKKSTMNRIITENNSIVDKVNFNIFPDFIYEFNFCERRFLYSYLLNSNSSYRKPFSQKFIFSEITKIISRESNNKNEIISSMLSLFPQWDLTSKTHIILNSLKYKRYSLSYTFYGDAKIDNRRYRILFPGENEDRIKQLTTRSKEIDSKIFDSITQNSFGNTNKEACYYCPEEWHCPHITYKEKVKQDEK